MSRLLSVNLGRSWPTPDDGSDFPVTGIDKRPVAGPVLVRAPGPKGTAGSGVVGDTVCDWRHHGGDYQAVYAYAREDLDLWADELGRELSGGVFGENLTTLGVDVTEAVLGEHWRIGDDLVLEVSCPRIPCNTFATWLGERGWIKRFTKLAKPGAYLRVVEPGEISAGDPVEVVDRPDHGVTVGLSFRAFTLEPGLLPRMVDVEALPPEDRDRARRRLGYA